MPRTISRREALRTLAAGTLAASSLSPGNRPSDHGASAASTAAPAGLPKTVIDTHTHFYDPTRPEGVPWPGKGNPELYRPMLPEHFQKIAGPAGVTGTVVIEASPWLEDNQWLLDLAAKNPVIVGIVGNLGPGEEGFAGHARRFAKNPLYRGIRINAGGLPKRLEQPAFTADLNLLAELDLELDVNGGPDILPGVARLAEKSPDLRIVINHLANVKNDGTVDADWLQGMQACAKHRRVFCKVSALAESARPKDDKGRAPRDPAFYVPLLDAVWKTWGDDRVIFGSNWPVSERAATYADAFRIAAEYALSKGKTPAEKFFAGNAKTAYQWVERATGA